MSPDEIKANANDNCLNPSNTNQMAWYRFNVPAPGDGSTISGYSTVEVQHPPIYPAHGLPTTYAYNSTNQVQTQTSPDGGTTNYWYDLLSRLTASQNAKQLSAGATTYSYTTYDNLGRIIEVGQKQNGNNLNSPDYVDSTTTANFLASGNNTQITRTYYDNLSGYTGSMLTTLGQSNLRKRVAASIYLDDPNTLISGMYYNYDLDGNVRTLYRQLPGLGTKQIGYEYDLISGKVNFVAYQQSQPDQFYYSYNYDADNRLTEAWSSPLANVVSYGRGSTLDQTYKRMDASYYYYPHGPLARMELGDVYGKVQGVDYAYTLQGWLKGVNTTAVDMSKDISGDGFNGSTIAKDAYGYALHYFNNDFKPVGTTISPFDQPAGGFTPLYNGNIAGSSMNLSQFAGYRQDYLYNYDQLNRILTVGVFRGNQYGQAATSTPENNEVFSYDGNGNIKGLLRNGTQAQGLQMDLLSYSYNKDSNGKLLNNQLNSVTDDPSSSNNYSSDLKGSTSYTYDQIGNLLTDSHEGITNIDWSVYGKIRNIYKNSGNISYQYDPAGNRQSKIYNNVTTWYVRDAQGNTLAVYDNSQNQVNWLEQHLYGSSRIGMWMPNTPVYSNNALNIWNTTGHKQYELSNHLGNVVTTVSDVINADASGNPLPDILSAQDYYAFGSQQPNRSYARSNAYRYGFNGKENDNDATTGFQDYGRREYDKLTGRFISVDPLTKEYPALTPYQFASNSPIAGRDRDGLEFEPSWSTTVPQKIREYETQLKKDDPKHADAIIRQHNIDAFLFVGGALTGGEGKLATTFWDLVMLGGSARTAQGIINHDKTQTTEGMHVVTGAIMGEVGGMLIGKTFEIISPLMRSAGKSLTGTWVKESISGWSTNAVAYQEFVTGVKAGQTFQVNGYNFDGFRNGILLDAKSGLGNFVDKQTGTFKQFFKGQESLVIQARNQLGAAKGAPIEWNFEIKAVRDATEKLFEKEGIKGITLKYTPKK
jgi:RHS repeat-associated protein